MEKEDTKQPIDDDPETTSIGIDSQHVKGQHVDGQRIGGHQTEDQPIEVDGTEHEQPDQEGNNKEETSVTATDPDQTDEYPTEIEDGEEYPTEVEDNDEYPDTDVMDSEDQYSGAEDSQDEEAENNETEDENPDINDMEEEDEEGEKDDMPNFETEEAFHLYLINSFLHRQPINVQPGVQWLTKSPSDNVEVTQEYLGRKFFRDVHTTGQECMKARQSRLKCCGLHYRHLVDPF
ncbi:hypothetical protein BZA77DRAFT_349377 [Pyronema omphalodes]|nr:hypothetical protein BZA77DRAFT_349377 [Pyronema omphalodes]